MIETLGAFSTKFRWMKPVILLVGVGFFVLFCITILGVYGISGDIYLIPSVLGVVWAALFFFMVSTFPHVPPKHTKKSGFFVRVELRLKRGVYHILGAVFVVLTVAVVMLSFKMFGIWRADF